MRFTRRLSLPAMATSFFATSVAAMLVLTGCAPAAPGGSAGDEGTVQVVASTNVYGNIAEQIGGDRVSVTSIIDSGSQDPHSYESTARDQLAVQRAQLVIENGGGYDEFMARLLAASTGAPIVVTAVQFAAGFTEEPGEDHAEDHVADGHAEDHDHAEDHATDSHAHDHDHDHGASNEHVWFDPAAMILLAEQIAEGLSTLDPAGAGAFAANAATLTAELEGVQAQLAALAEAHAGEGVFLTEPLAGYLVTTAGLVDVAPAGFAAAVESGRDVSPAALLAALRVIESGEARAVLTNGQTAGAETKRVAVNATAAGIPVVAFTETLPGESDGADMTYAAWMRDNIERLATALGA